MTIGNNSAFNKRAINEFSTGKDFLPSGLNGKALNISLEHIPSRSSVRNVIPKECFPGKQLHHFIF